MPPEIDRPICARIPNDYGEFQLCLYLDHDTQKEHLALVMGEVRGEENVLVRVHSECYTGEVLGSLRCDCGEQLRRSMTIIANAGKGILVYLRQEGRGIGLIDKLRAYNLQDQGYDTVEANLALGHQADERDYTFAAKILRQLDVRSLTLITNNPSKIQALEDLGVEVMGRTPLTPSVNPENENYLLTKALRMNHLLSPDEIRNANGTGK